MTLPDRRAKHALQIGLGVLVSGLLVWLSFHHTRFGDLWQTVRHVRVVPLLAGVALATLAFPLRVPRWRLLLRADDGSALQTGSLWNAIAIGFAANNVLPFRAGEVLRVTAISRSSKVSFASALSSVAIERVLDGLTVIALLGIGLVSAHLPTDVRIGKYQIATVARDTGLVCVVALVMAIVAAWRRELALELFERLLPSGPLSGKIVGFVDSVLRGLGAMRDPRRAVPIVLWSAVIWLVSASSYFLFFRAFGFAIPFGGALVLQGVLMIGIATPSLPGGLGVVEAVCLAVLLILGIGHDPALAYGVTYHISTFIPITSLGAIAAVREGTRLRVPAQ